MPELMMLLDPLTGAVLVEAPDRVGATVHAELAPLLGGGMEVGCARPLVVLPPPAAETETHGKMGMRVRIAGYYHGSLVEGPGRRSVALFSGCTLGCAGCWVPSLHPVDAGTLVPVERLADALLDPAEPRDGVSLLGGEPFQQVVGLLALVRALRARGCGHILVYTGYTYEALLRRARRQPAIASVLHAVDVLIDGPYVAACVGDAGPWTGSGNQRVIDLVASRRAGRVVALRSAE